MFWWTMLIILLALGAVASWTFCIFAFSYPEKPINYGILQKFNKLDPPKRFTDADAPKIEFYQARDLYDRFNLYEQRHIDEMNGLLLRNYIENFQRAEPGFTMNMVGKFKIEAKQKLGGDDLIMRGTAIKARCIDFPDVTIEYILPIGGERGGKDIPNVSDDVLKVGEILDLGSRSRSRFAPFNVVLHISRSEGNEYCFCVIPIVYAKEHLARGMELILAPPQILNIEGNMPPLRKKAVEEVGKPAVEEEGESADLEEEEAPDEES